ncbi:hypothetical protein BU24DRAFT_450914 [Aaosphaeria arxii CBS 175.79]|uniref:GPI anchored protein n=1 Tax=Aaosphaeria arxii CBS 175.79 TaxID=1450172 RepID=A0A6A5XSU2_9PLEO|nr:uncharacterized protein BU24DRAFT_450914 [Aaosphaeria arxii CBS 175.79]KAF2016385.1 hypothetical protein BU24DRAFT_450914 [Aaosphaeria arxii CBS 175.79]
MVKYVAPATLLLLASAVSAQETTEQIFSIQTDTTNFQASPTVGPPGSTTEGIMSILPIFTSPTESVTGIMSIPQGETPISTDTVSGIMSIPQGETPISTGLSSSGASASTSGGTTPTPSGSASGSPSGSSTPSESPGAAPHGRFGGDGKSGLFAVALSGLSITFGFAWTLL